MMNQEDAEPRSFTDSSAFRALAERLAARTAGRDLTLVDVPVGETEQDRAERVQAQQMHRDRQWRELAGSLADANLASLEPQQDRCALRGQSPAVSDWLDSEHLNLLLSGPTRHGKTYAAYAIGNAARDRGLWVAAYRLSRANSSLRDDERRDRMQRILDGAHLLILDDVGSEHTTDWTGERLQDLLDERSTHERRTIMTTNLEWRTARDPKTDLPTGPTGMVERYGERIAARLVERARVVVIRGERRLSGPDPW